MILPNAWRMHMKIDSAQRVAQERAIQLTSVMHRQRIQRRAFYERQAHLYHHQR